MNRFSLKVTWPLTPHTSTTSSQMTTIQVRRVRPPLGVTESFGRGGAGLTAQRLVIRVLDLTPSHQPTVMVIHVHVLTWRCIYTAPGSWDLHDGGGIYRTQCAFVMLTKLAACKKFTEFIYLICQTIALNCNMIAKSSMRLPDVYKVSPPPSLLPSPSPSPTAMAKVCLLYTSDAADE